MIRQNKIKEKMKRLSFQQACSKYIHRFTMDHVPQWAADKMPSGDYYAPQYSSDLEWYENTYFPGEIQHIMGKNHKGNCDSRNCSFPLGTFLTSPFQNK
jgi:hypothetical protein